MVGGRETGNETYIKGLVGGLAGTPGLDLVVFHVGSPWAHGGDHVRFQRLLTGSPYVRLGAELPLRARSGGLDVLHRSESVVARQDCKIGRCGSRNADCFSTSHGR